MEFRSNFILVTSMNALKMPEVGAKGGVGSSNMTQMSAHLSATLSRWQRSERNWF